MADVLPEITMPSVLPSFLVAGHGFEPRSVYVDTAMRTGHPRRRRVYTAAPRVQAVSLLMSVEQMAAFDAWFEVALLAGERMFSALVASEDGLRTWWAARWIEPYTADPIPGQWWRVTGQLLLTGEGSQTAPVNTGMAAEIGVGMTGIARLTVPTMLAAEVSVALQGVVGLALLSAEISVALTGSSVSIVDRVTEAGTTRITEDGQQRVTED